MRIAFRVDSSRIIGTGHVYRCLTLAQRLREDGAECHFIMRELEGALFALVREAGFSAHALPPAPVSPGSVAEGHAHWLGVPWEQDAADSVTALAAIGRCEWLVVDHYAVDARWEAVVAAHADRLLVIDDLADRPHDCDVLVDQNLQERANRYAGLVPDSCKQLLGPRYALLRPEFAEARETCLRDYGRTPEKILLFMGGIDLPSLTPVVLEAIEALEPKGAIVDVVLGAGNPLREQIESDWADRSWLRVYRAPTDLLTLMCGADIAIGAGGTATWERCCLGLPTVIISIAANQRPGAAAMNAQGAALYAGDFEQLDRDALAASIALLLRNRWAREAIGRASADLVDGGGVDRIAHAMRRRRVQVRPAEQRDCEGMFAWRNADWTRRFMRDSGPISHDQHLAWFARTLIASDRDLLIGEADDGPVGVIRFDRDGEDAEVSIFLVPGREGQGVGSDLLRAGLLWLDRNRPGTKVVLAEILEGNLASQRAFLAAGFDAFARSYRRVRAS